MATSLSSIAPADCFARATQLRLEIDDLRAELGRPPFAPHEPIVRGAEPRQCWGAALGLLRRADQLAREGGIDGTLTPFSAVPLAATRPADVLALLDASAARIAAFKAVHGANVGAPPPPKEAGRTPSDVLASILEASRQLDRLLERPTTPNDVYAEVSRASAYAGALLAHVGSGETTRRPPATASRRKQPADCFATLAACLPLATRASRSAGLATLERSDVPPEDGLVPGDVLDLATLITGELAAAHTIAGAPYVADTPVAHVRRRTPSDVLALSAQLKGQLTALAQAVEASPLQKR